MLPSQHESAARQPPSPADARAIEREFEAAVSQTNMGGLWITAVLCVVLLPLFWALDWVVIPHAVWLTLWLRLLCAAGAGALLLAHALAPGRLVRHLVPLSAGYMLMVVMCIAFMSFMHDGYESPYYAGISIVVLCVGVFFSWRTGTAILFNAAVYLIYMAPLLLGLLPVKDPSQVLTSQFFLLTSMGIAIVAQYRSQQRLHGECLIKIKERRLTAEIEQMASTDALTGLCNRRQFFTLAQAEFERARRYGHPLSLVMLDVDHFKHVNDTHGHGVGDEVLRAVARRIVDGMRQADIAARYGGEEFVIMLPETPGAAATQMFGERLRSRVSDAPIDTSAGRLEVTISMGVATVQADRETLANALKRADEALYAAKRAGRNRVVQAHDPMPA